MELSVIIPTFNERDNIRPMVERITAALDNVMERQTYEIWFIDDSRDDTPLVLEHVAKSYEQVQYLHRENGTGLASAVVEGFQLASGRYIIVMDADLQHPPELLPIIYNRLSEGIDVVIPSRFVQGGSDGGLNWIRKFISWTARVIGQLALRKLRRISDCTGGFFGMKKSVIERARLSPIGWKILIEVLVKGHYHTVHEIPYEFVARDAGESKMSLREQCNYLRHIGKLMLQSEEDRRFVLFCTIGASGVLVNMVVLSVCLYFLHLSEIPSSVIASLIAMFNNFLWNDKVTWRDLAGKGHFSGYRFFLFIIISFVSIGITTLVMDTLRLLSIPVPIGQCIGIGIATYWSYTSNNRWTWRRNEFNEYDSQGDGIVVTREIETIRH